MSIGTTSGRRPVGVRIAGTGSALPKRCLTNADLEKIVDTNDEWITTRTGIKQRHKAAENEYTSQFGTLAAKQALERAGLKPEDIDIIVCATTTPDQIMPSTGALIQAQLGAVNAAGMDIFAVPPQHRYRQSIPSFPHKEEVICGEQVGATFDEGDATEQRRATMPGNQTHGP